MAHDSEDVELTVETVVAVTEDALLCRFDTGDEIWVPRRYVEDTLENVGDQGDVSIPEWLAEKEGLI
jgi:hypothetical protein